MGFSGPHDYCWSLPWSALRAGLRCARAQHRSRMRFCSKTFDGYDRQPYGRYRLAAAFRQADRFDPTFQHADTISVMLLAFPHLFPPSTNQWQPNAKRDPARDTFASPDIWTNFADFYQQAAAASRLAFNASQAKREDPVCEGRPITERACHSPGSANSARKPPIGAVPRVSTPP